VSRKASAEGQASHYYSLTRMDTRGHVRVGRDSFAVNGSSWMDHEFSTSALAVDQVGWDWFGLQLDDGRELMLYLMRRRDGTHDPVSNGTLVERNGAARHLTREAFTVESAGRWDSPRSGARYPTRWRVRVPGAGLDLTVESRLADQEQSDAGGGIAYWEGAVRVRGMGKGTALTGRGYVELTGYAGALPGL
jgi:predicted secreted hydrolase